MLDLLAASRDALATFLRGQQDSVVQRRADLNDQSTGGGGSGTLFASGLPSAGVTIDVPTINNNGNLGQNNTPQLITTVSLDDQSLLLDDQPLPPPPPPPIFAATVAFTSEIPDGSPGELSAPDTATGSLPLTGGTPSTLSVSNAFVSVSWSTGALPIEIAGLLATALQNALTTTITTAGGVNSVAFTFSAGDHNFDMLADQETLLIVYNVTVANGTATTTQPLTITVNGSNDAPTITAQMDGAVSAVDLTDTGKVLFEDADLSDTHTASVSFVTSTLVDPLSGLPVKLGSLVAGPAVTTGTVGVVGWNFSVASSDVHKLAFGQTVTETYQIIVSDGAGSAPENIDVTITNNEPLNIILTGTGGESVTEGAAASVLARSIEYVSSRHHGDGQPVDHPAGWSDRRQRVRLCRSLPEGPPGCRRERLVVWNTGSLLSNMVTVALTFNLDFDGNFKAFSVSIADPSSGSVAAQTASATIVDNDAGGIAWSISGGGNVAEGAAASFTVSYGGATLAEGNTVSINLAFAAGGTEAADLATPSSPTSRRRSPCCPPGTASRCRAAPSPSPTRR